MERTVWGTRILTPAHPSWAGKDRLPLSKVGWGWRHGELRGQDGQLAILTVDSVYVSGASPALSSLCTIDFVLPFSLLFFSVSFSQLFTQQIGALEYAISFLPEESSRPPCPPPHRFLCPPSQVLFASEHSLLLSHKLCDQ